MGSEGNLVDLLPPDVKEPGTLVQKMRDRRSNGKLMNLDRMLLNSPPFAEGWNVLLGNVRNSMTSLESRLLELAILVIACTNQAPYEFVHHTTPFLSAYQDMDPEGALKKLEFLKENLLITDRDIGDRILYEGGENLNKSHLTTIFDEEEKLVMQITIDMSYFDVASEKRQATLLKLKEWKKMKSHDSSSAAVVELVGAISAYNMVSRFLIYTEGIIPENERARWQ